MDKITYLAELAEGLARWVPERDRQDILRYYAEYFEEAGPGREAEVVAELGDPWALSCRLAVEGGFVTQEAANSWTPRRNRRKMWPLVLAGTLAAVVVIGVSVASLAAKIGRFVGNAVSNRGMSEAIAVEDVGYSGGYWSMEDGDLEYFTAIDAEISLGEIHVYGGEDFSLSIWQYGGLGGYEPDWEVKNSTLKIRDGNSSSSHVELTDLADLASLFDGQAVDVTITVPYMEHLDRLAVKTDLGDVYLSDLFVEGDVSAETNLGNVECYEVQTMKKLSLTADVGDVMLNIGSLYGGMEIELKTDVGTVEAGLGCREVECGYEVRTGVGEVTVNGRDYGAKAEHRADTASYRLDAESDTGDINVYFYE